MVEAAPLVAVGEVLKPHGVTGEVKVRSLSDRTEDRFRRLLRRHLIASVGNGGLDCRYALAPDLRRASPGQPAGPMPLRRPLDMVVGAVCPCLCH